MASLAAASPLGSSSPQTIGCDDRSCKDGRVLSDMKRLIGNKEEELIRVKHKSEEYEDLVRSIEQEKSALQAEVYNLKSRLREVEEALERKSAEAQDVVDQSKDLEIKLVAEKERGDKYKTKANSWERLSRETEETLGRTDKLLIDARRERDSFKEQIASSERSKENEDKAEINKLKRVSNVALEAAYLHKNTGKDFLDHFEGSLQPFDQKAFKDINEMMLLTEKLSLLGKSYLSDYTAFAESIDRRAKEFSGQLDHNDRQLKEVLDNDKKDNTLYISTDSGTQDCSSEPPIAAAHPSGKPRLSTSSNHKSSLIERTSSSTKENLRCKQPPRGPKHDLSIETKVITSQHSVRNDLIDRSERRANHTSELGSPQASGVDKTMSHKRSQMGSQASGEDIISRKKVRFSRF